MEIIIGLIIGLLIGIVAYFLFQKQLKTKAEQSGEQLTAALEIKLRTMMPELLNETNKSLIDMANEKLGSEKKEMKTDLEAKRSEIERMVKTIQQELKLNQDALMKSDKERIGSFQALQQRLDEYKQLTTQLKTSTDNLNKVLSDNQKRGVFGEQVAEDLLKMSGFVKGTNYTVQEGVEGARPDFTIYLPDKTKVNIDAKFPFSNLQRYVSTEDPDQKETYRKLFVNDVKEKIKQVSTRDYINPEEKTVDFVILFIPNEMIFSFIYDEMPEVWLSAMEKKVILAGPFSFTAILRMVQQAYDNFRYQSNIHHVISHIKAFDKEFTKFSEAYSKVGEKIAQLEKTYETVNSTRYNALARTVDKIKLADPTQSEGTGGELKLLPDQQEEN